MAVESASTDLIIKLPAVMTAETFTDDKEFEKLYSNILEAVNKHKPDVSTKTGRDAIASLAYKVARTKTALDGQGKALTEEWRKSTNKVNETRKIIVTRLDALKDQVRKPLDDWEAAESARVAGHTNRLSDLIAYSKVGFGHSSADLQRMYEEVKAIPTGKDAWEEFAPQAGVAHENALDTLTRLYRTALKQEQEAAELEQLRAEKAERDRIEAERLAAEQEAKEAAERAERERMAEERRQAEIARAAEEARQRAEREAQEKIEAAKHEAERQAEEAARREKEAAERHARELAEAKAAAERQAEAERQRISAEKAAEEAEQKRRDADKAHRKAINTAIVNELVECSGITAEQGQKIVIHIVGGLVPNVTLKY